MSDNSAGATRHRSPFEGHKPGARPTADGQLGVQLRAETLPGLMLITTWTGGVAALQCALANMLGVAQVPDRTGLVATVPAGLLMCTGPQEYQLLMSAPSPGFARPPEGVQENLGTARRFLVTTPGAGGASALRRHVGADIGSVTDLGHARCRIRISGTHCCDTLSKLFALDQREVAWPIGELRLTGYHHVPCMAHRRAADDFDLYVFSTYAFDQLATLLDTAQEYGVELKLGAGSID